MSRRADTHITDAQRRALAEQLRRKIAAYFGLPVEYFDEASAEDVHRSDGMTEWRLFYLRAYSDFLNMLETLGWIEAEEFQKLNEELVRAVDGEK